MPYENDELSLLRSQRHRPLRAEGRGWCRWVVAGLAALGWGFSALPSDASLKAADYEVAQVKAHEQHQLGELIRASDADHRAIASGSWSGAGTWSAGQVPGQGAQVWIPEGLRVLVDAKADEEAVKWILVEGELAFAPKKDTALKVTTLVIGETGALEMGTAQHRIHAGRSARIIFADRGERDRVADPMDLTGGLLAAGKVGIYGAVKTAWVLPEISLSQGLQELTVDRAPEGWKVGDQVLIPGTDADQVQDEIRTLAAVSRSKKSLRFDRPLDFEHWAPASAGVPIGNLTRNIILSSENSQNIPRRAHVMLMHRQTGTVIDGAAFLGLGRTDTRIAHTVPRLTNAGNVVEGTDANTIARYAVHFHVRSGAHRDVAPHIFRRSVIIDSPKHGLVNHGGHVLAQENITYKIDGSHFFGENGSEIGTFEGNLAVRSEGSPEGYRGFGLKSRMYMFDFGHGGHGFWTQGSGIVMKGNYAFGHQGAGFSIYSIPMEEGGEKVKFLASNLGNEMRAQGAEALDIRNVPFEFYGNTAAASHAGLEIWRHQRYLEADSQTPSRVEDSTFWALGGDGVILTYSRNIAFRNVSVYGDPENLRSIGFGGVNSSTGGITYEGVHVEGFRIGIDLPTRGVNAVRNSYLNNHRNIRVRLIRNSGFDAVLENLEFGTLDVPRQFDIFMEGWSAEDGETPRRADLSGLFERSRLRVVGTDPKLDGKQIYFSEQGRTAFPYNGLDVPELEKRSTYHVWWDYKVAFSGAMAPADARTVSRIWGLVGSPVDSDPMLQLESPRFSKVVKDYALALHDEQGNFLQLPAVDLKEGWNFLSVPVFGEKRTALVYGDTTPPRWVMHENFPTEIHPDDLKFGIRVTGRAVDQLAGLETSITHAPFVSEFEMTSPGVATFVVNFHDEAYNWGQVPVQLKVTESALRRGPFVAHYLQGFRPPEELEARRIATANP